MKYRLELSIDKDSYDLMVRDDKEVFALRGIEPPRDEGSGSLTSYLFERKHIGDQRLVEMAHSLGIENMKHAVGGGEFVGRHEGLFYHCEIVDIETIGPIDVEMQVYSLDVKRIPDTDIELPDKVDCA